MRRGRRNQGTSVERLEIALRKRTGETGFLLCLPDAGPMPSRSTDSKPFEQTNLSGP
mgnify:CR=1 FL=1